jgi:soluble lytic murein transglycosylase-like protein
VPAAVAATPQPEPPAGGDLIAARLASNPFDSERAERTVASARRRAKRAAAPAKRRPAPAKTAVPPVLQAIAACESGGNPRAVSSTGAYRGKYQFSPATWQAVGGTGDPAAAPEAEQDRRAAILLARSGPGQWPVCAGRG